MDLFRSAGLRRVIYGIAFLLAVARAVTYFRPETVDLDSNSRHASDVGTRP